MFGIFFQFSVPYLLTLAIDDRCWSNRGSCCEIIPEISRLCTAETRELRLAPLFITLIYDDARWVKILKMHLFFQFLIFIRGKFILFFYCFPIF